MTQTRWIDSRLNTNTETKSGSRKREHEQKTEGWENEIGKEAGIGQRAVRETRDSDRWEGNAGLYNRHNDR